jgi:hypothetical protein
MVLRHSYIYKNQFGSVKNFIQLLRKRLQNQNAHICVDLNLSNVPNSKIKKKSAMGNCILSFCQTFCRTKHVKMVSCFHAQFKRALLTNITLVLFEFFMDAFNVSF